MPRYSYVCEKCEKQFSAFHSMNEKLETCDYFKCEENGKLRKIPSLFTKKIKKEKVVGEVVKQFIEDAKQEVKEEMKMLQQKEYKDEEKT